MRATQCIIAVLAFLVLLSQNVAGRTEEERLAAYAAANHTWPIPQFQPPTPGWDKLMRHRLRQVEEISGIQDRFEGYAQVLSASFIQPNYTQFGFGLARAPDDLMEALRQGIRDGLDKGPREEYHIPAIEGLRPWFIDRPDLTKRVLTELQTFPETWAGMELTPVIAYGFRLYRNQSRLHMHVDKSQTHVISFILHIDSSEDAEPWPIMIEDLQGNTHEVTLTSGDILFYESSKCFHGRPRRFNGTWYSSVFVHYYPTYGYKENFDDYAKVNVIPPHWSREPQSHFEIPLQMHGTAMEEPSCPHGWCATEYSNKWSGPAEEGFWTAPTGEKFPFEPRIKPPCFDQDDRCRKYLTRNRDECNENPNYMHKYCAKSCNTCTLNAASTDEL